MYEAIVVGARCAGSPVAMLLARYWHKVLLVDRATFPSDTISTHGITCILVGWPHEEFHQVRADLENQYREAIETVSPILTEWLHTGERVERYWGMADLPNFFRKPFGPGWALVGDAGYHKDPVAAHGIADAFRDADLLAEAIHCGLSGEKPMEAALADYERQRNEDALPRYQQNCQSARFQPPPEAKLELRAALRDANQADIDPLPQR